MSTQTDGPYLQARYKEFRELCLGIQQREERLLYLTGKPEAELTPEEKAYLEQELGGCSDDEKIYPPQLLEEAQKIFDPYSDDGLVGAYESRLRILKLLGLPIPHEPLHP